MSMSQLLKNLRAQYISELHMKIREIEELLAQKSSPVVFYDIFHKLKGSGLTYGCAEVSDISVVAEYCCQNTHPRWPEAVEMSVELLKRVYIARLQHLDQVYDLGADSQYTLLVDLMPRSA